MNGHADVWRLFDDAKLFGDVVAALARPFEDAAVTRVAGIESRGVILGGAVATALGVGFAAIRKEAGLFPGPKLAARAPSDYRGNEVLLRLRRASPGEDDASVVVDQLPTGVADALGTYHALVRADEVRGG